MFSSVSKSVRPLLACLPLAVLGCGPSGAGDAPPAATNDAAAAATADDAVGPNPTPATFREIVAAVDLREFPVMDGAIYIQKSPAGAHFSVPNGDKTKAVEFLESKLAPSGWKSDPKLRGIYEHGAQLIFVKDGFRLYASLGVSPADKNLNVGLFHLANIDARKLPQFAAAEQSENLPSRVTCRTDAKPAEIKKFFQSELPKQGWREYRRPPVKGLPASVRLDDATLRFFQRGVGVEISLYAFDGKMQVSTTVRVLPQPLPVLADAAGIEFQDDPLHLFFTTKVEVSEILPFYRTELAALGWKERTQNKTGDKRAELHFEAPGEEPIKLDVLHDADSKITLVLVNRLPKELSKD